MNADGSEQQRLTYNEARDESPRRSPDGSQIVFVSDRNPKRVPDLYLADPAGSQPVRLTNDEYKDRNPAWSPDGQWIVFESQNEEGDWDIYVMRPDAKSSPIPLVQEAGEDGAPAWSSLDDEGRSWIAFHSNRTGQFQIWELPILDIQDDKLTIGEVRQLTKDAGSHKLPAWSPDGRQLAYTLGSEEQADVYILTLDENREPITSRLFSSSKNILYKKASQPAWYPGGGWIAYVLQIKDVRQIYIVSLDGEGEPRPLTEGKENLEPDWSSEPRFKAWPTPTATLTSSPTPTDTPTPTATDTAEFVPQSTDTPTPTDTWTPTPTFTPTPPPKIAYVSTQDDDAEIWVMDANGANPRQLTFNSDTDESPCWSPDGRQIAFMREGEGEGNKNIWIMSAEGENEIKLDIEPPGVLFSDDNDEMWPAWSPNGEWIVFQSNWYGSDNIWIVNVESKQLRQLTFGSDSDRKPSWSAGGRRVVYESNASGVYQLLIIEVFDEMGELIVDNGNVPRRLTLDQNNNYRPVWSPVGDQLAFWSDQDGNWEIYVKKDAIRVDDQGLYLRITDSLFEESFPAWSPGIGKIAFVSDREGNKQIFVVNINDVELEGAAHAKWAQLTSGEGDHYHPAWWGLPQ